MKSWLLKLATKGKKGKTISSIKPFSSINAPYNIGAGTKKWSAKRRADAAKTLQSLKRYDKRNAEEAAKRKAAEAKKMDEYKVSEKIPVEDQVGGQRRMLADKKSKLKWY